MLVLVLWCWHALEHCCPARAVTHSFANAFTFTVFLQHLCILLCRHISKEEVLASLRQGTLNERKSNMRSGLLWIFESNLYSVGYNTLQPWNCFLAYHKAAIDVQPLLQQHDITLECMQAISLPKICGGCHSRPQSNEEYAGEHCSFHSSSKTRMTCRTNPNHQL